MGTPTALFLSNFKVSVSSNPLPSASESQIVPAENSECEGKARVLLVGAVAAAAHKTQGVLTLSSF